MTIKIDKIVVCILKIKISKELELPCTALAKKPYDSNVMQLS